MKRFFWTLIIGVFVGGALTSYVAPKVIAWYSEPPVNWGVNCRGAIEWSMAKLQMAQIVGSIIGGLLGAGSYFGLKGRGNKGAHVDAEPMS